MAVAESRLAEIDELIEGAEADIENLRSGEKSAPLQKGCAFFGSFMMVIVTIALFMLLGRSFVGGWLFFVSVAVVILLNVIRIRRKFASAAHLDDLSRDRTQIEEELVQLQAERDRIQKLKAALRPEESAE